uniref:NAB domain-containing protein n=1 Tax=Kalanchoe fedtschenkoi TaxID=63787 RepID=A0A7N1A1L9_KALFE
MGALSPQDSKRMYSWLWDSHISPKNSKWLQENLADIDSTVKQMIKIIEEDGDSFARRAEMYYKRRPELMRLVEQFYRAYRGLAERYSHATRVIRQAHDTMAEAFPGQVPPLLTEDSPARIVAEHRGFDMPLSVPAMFSTEEMNRFLPGAANVVKGSGGEGESLARGEGSKQLDLFGFGEGYPGSGLFADGTAKKVMSFLHEKGAILPSSSVDLLEFGPEFKPETDASVLRESIAKLEAEKEAGLARFQKILEQISCLESRVTSAEEESRRLNEHAGKAEAEVQLLNEALKTSEAEKEAALIRHEQCGKRIAAMESELSLLPHDTGESELKDALASAEAEKDAILAQHNQCADLISSLQKKLLDAEDDARRLSERARKAEDEVEGLKKEIAKLEEEKEVSSIVYWQSIDKISSLELKLSSTQVEVQRLNSEISSTRFKLQGAEERYQLLERSRDYLQSDMHSLVQEIETQRRLLLDKQMEFGRFWTQIQEEHSRYMEAETAFQKLQLLHSRSQGELRSVTSQLQSKEQLLKELEARNRNLEDEIVKLEEEMQNLNERNLCSEQSGEYLMSDNKELRAKIVKLDEEVELRIDQRNSVQQQVYRLQNDIKGLQNRHDLVVGQMVSVGLDSEFFRHLVGELQDENGELKDICQREREAENDVLKKLRSMEKLLEEKAVLEKSIVIRNEALEKVRKEVGSLEESCQLAADEKLTLELEKAILVLLVEGVTCDADKLSRKNAHLESSLIDVNSELHKLRQKSSSLEHSVQSLDLEKTALSLQVDVLASQHEKIREMHDELQKKHEESEIRNNVLEKEKESSLSRIKELISLQESSDLAEAYEARSASLESQLCLLRDDKQKLKNENQEEVDKALKAEVEIFILRTVMEDMEGAKASLVGEFQKLVASTKFSEKIIFESEQKIVDQQMQLRSLLGEVEILGMGMNQVSRILEAGEDPENEDKSMLEATQIELLLEKLKDLKHKLRQTQESNELLSLEKSVLVMLFGQLRMEAAEAEKERKSLLENLNSESQKLVTLRTEMENLIKMNEVLRQKDDERNDNEVKLKNDAEALNVKFSELQESYQNTQTRNANVIQENKSLRRDFLELKRKNRALEDENCTVLVEALSMSNVSLVFENFVSEKTSEVAELAESLRQLDSVKSELMDIEFEAVLRKLLVLSVSEVAFTVKFHELTEQCRSLEKQRSFEVGNVQILNERVRSLEGENEGLKAQLDTFTAAVDSLRDCVASLESHAFFREKLFKSNAEESKGDRPDSKAELLGGVAKVQDLQNRIKSVEAAMEDMEVERYGTPDSRDAAIICEVPSTEAELGYGCGSSDQGVNTISQFTPQRSGMGGLGRDLRIKKTAADASDVSDIPKDISLDQRSRRMHYGGSRKDSVKFDDRMLELWETDSDGGSIGLTVSEGQKAKHISEIEAADEDLDFVDKLEVSKRFVGSNHEENKRKLLEKLRSDGLKLSNLQITVRDLKAKAEISEKMKKKDRDIEYSTVKEQLEEAEEAIGKLSETNAKLRRAVEDNDRMTSIGRSRTEYQRSWSLRRRNIQDHAQRGSERFGRLHLEVMKLQFLLRKLDIEQEKKPRTRIADPSPKRLLKDYLYNSRGRSMRLQGQNQSKKKMFCACIKPPTRGD